MAVKELQWDLKFLWNCRFYFLCFGQVFFKVIATQKQHLLKFLMISELQRVDCFLNWSWWTSVLPLIEMISMLLLEHVTGIRGTASRWFRSYLQATFKFVRVPDMCSSYTRISHGVPQGTVFGSILFTLFMFPLGTLIWQHQINSLAMLMILSCIYLWNQRKQSTQAGLEDVKSWMTSNFLLLNSDKTEVIVFGPKLLGNWWAHHIITLYSFSLFLASSYSVRNLGVIFD